MLIWEGFTLDWNRGLLGLGERTTDVSNRALYIESTDQLLAAARNSLTVAAVTTTLSTVIGTATVIALARYRFRGRGAYGAAMLLPMMMPDIVVGIGLLIFFVTAGMQLSLLTIIIGYCTFLTSCVFIVVQARLAGLDPTLEEASADLGDSEWATFREVLLPQLAPGLLGGALLAFVIAMDDLVITYFIAGTDSTTLPLFIFGMIRRGVKPEINAIATLIIRASVLIAALGLWLRSRRTDGMTRPRARDLGLPFPGTPGPSNATTDVPGVEVGFCTLTDPTRRMRTGVTAVLPRGRSPEPRPVWAGHYALNGKGEMTGTHWIGDAGYFLGPILVTSTHGVGAAHTGATRWMLDTYAELSRDGHA